jgi:hypothetical protein
MRTVRNFILASASCAVVATSYAALPQQPPQEGARPPALDARKIEEVGRMNPDEAESFVTIFFPALPPHSPAADKEIAGLSPDSHPELLTWERVYALALLRARAGTTPSTAALDPKGFPEIVARHGLADFSRFRRDFLAVRPGADGEFRDPSGDYVDLLRRIQVIDNARRDVARHENFLTLYRELIRGEASGLSALQVDLAEAVVVGARQRLADETARFRDALDELKASLGLSPRALAIPSRQDIAAFREAFEAVQNWHRDPKRTLNVLHQLIARLPALGEVNVDGQPIVATIEGNPNRLDEVLAAATRVANKNRASGKNGAARETDVQLELRTGRRIRRLVEAHRAYQTEKRRYELANRLISEAVTQFVAPPAGGTQVLAQAAGAVVKTEEMRAQSVQIQRAEDRLVGLWASFKGERLALYRDLGILPYDDWTSFYGDLAAQLGPIK